MKEAKNGRIMLTIDEKGNGHVMIDATKSQTKTMVYGLLNELRKISRDTYEAIMERIIREDIKEDLRSDDKVLFDLLFGGDDE